MNNVSLHGRVTSINEAIVNSQRVANVFLRDTDLKKPISFHLSFWNEAADFVMENVRKDDGLSATGFIYGLVVSEKGAYLEVRKCELQSISRETKIVVEDIVPHL